MSPRTARMTKAGMLMAVGLMLPFACAHGLGLPGNVLLPMHIPVLLIGLLCGPAYGALCGLAIPALNCALTGMPAAYPMLPIMAAELTTYGFVGGLLYTKTPLSAKRWGAYPALVGAMVCGRAAYGLVFALLLLANAGLKALSVWGALATGLPGIFVQLLLIPAIVTAAKGAKGKERKNMLESAINLIKEGSASCVVMKEGKIVRTSTGTGLRPLIELYDAGALTDAFVADKIIGKAAAMVLTLGGAKEAYGDTMSRAAKAYLEARGIACSYGRCIEVVSNRAGDGICPMERTVMEIEDPEEGLAALRQTIAALQKRA